MSLSKTQLSALYMARQRPDRAIELPPYIRGAAARKFVGALFAAGLVEEIRARGKLPIWRRDENGAHTLRLTRSGLQQLRGHSPPGGDNRAHKHDGPLGGRTPQSTDTPHGRAGAPRRMAQKATSALEVKAPRRSGPAAGPVSSKSKQARLIALLLRPEGATLAALMQASGWQQHSVRGFLAGVVRKKLGLELLSSKAESGRIYRIVSKPKVRQSRLVPQHKPRPKSSNESQ